MTAVSLEMSDEPFFDQKVFLYKKNWQCDDFLLNLHVK